MTDRQWEVFFEVHSDLPREGPGGAQSTERAYSCLRNVPENPQVLDIGCGPGAQTLCLSQRSKGAIFAVDSHAPFLDRLSQTIQNRGLNDLIHPTLADMRDLPFGKGTFDVLWAEGSIYNIGVETGLKLWKPLLKQKGSIAFTEISWLKSDMPKELSQFWQAAYPAMSSIDQNVHKIEGSGYSSTDCFVLPESDWWDDYYNPILKKLPALLAKYETDGEAREVLRMEETEIDLFRRYSEYYGYVFYIAENEGNQ